jgi:uncharacterized membrane protein YccF (DUF307 family)
MGIKMNLYYVHNVMYISKSVRVTNIMFLLIMFWIFLAGMLLVVLHVIICVSHELCIIKIPTSKKRSSETIPEPVSICAIPTVSEMFIDVGYNWMTVPSKGRQLSIFRKVIKN